MGRRKVRCSSCGGRGGRGGSGTGSDAGNAGDRSTTDGGSWGIGLVGTVSATGGKTSGSSGCSGTTASTAAAGSSVPDVVPGIIDVAGASNTTAATSGASSAVRSGRCKATINSHPSVPCSSAAPTKDAAPYRRVRVRRGSASRGPTASMRMGASVTPRPSLDRRMPSPSPSARCSASLRGGSRPRRRQSCRWGGYADVSGCAFRTAPGCCRSPRSAGRAPATGGWPRRAPVRSARCRSRRRCRTSRSGG